MHIFQFRINNRDTREHLTSNYRSLINFIYNNKTWSARIRLNRRYISWRIHACPTALCDKTKIHKLHLLRLLLIPDIKKKKESDRIFSLKWNDDRTTWRISESSNPRRWNRREMRNNEGLKKRDTKEKRRKERNKEPRVSSTDRDWWKPLSREKVLWTDSFPSRWVGSGQSGATRRVSPWFIEISRRIGSRGYQPNPRKERVGRPGS